MTQWLAVELLFKDKVSTVFLHSVLCLYLPFFNLCWMTKSITCLGVSKVGVYSTHLTYSFLLL